MMKYFIFVFYKKRTKLHSNLFFGRGRRTRTLTGGFGDRCATINTIPLNHDNYYTVFLENMQPIYEKKLFLFGNNVYKIPKNIYISF